MTSQKFDFDDLLKRRIKPALESDISKTDLEFRIIQTIQHSSKRGIDFLWISQWAGGIAGMLLIVFILSMFISRPASLTIQFLSGNGEIVVNGEKKAIQRNPSTLSSGVELFTDTNQIAVNLGEKTTIILDQKTKIQYTDTRSIFVETGRFFYGSHNENPTAWEFQTSLGTLQPVGTQFDLIVDMDQLLLKVFEGTVLVQTTHYEKSVQKGESSILTSQQCEIDTTPPVKEQWWSVTPTVPWTQFLNRQQNHSIN